MKNNPLIEALAEDERPTLASRLKQARAASGLSQPGLAEAAGLHLDTIRSLEQGRRTIPTMRTLAAPARALGVTMDELGGEAR